MTGRMTVSVALCTFNGARFLGAQLDSLAAQTQPPDELVACDDGSTDGTVRVLEEFRARAPFPVHVHVNARTLRSTKNFERAIGLCAGDVIALCDQDDVWLPAKLERLAASLAASPEAGLVFSDAEVVDEALRPLHSRLWRYARFTPRKQRAVRRGGAFAVLRALNVVTGATMAFRAGLRELVLPIPADIGLIHDGWIALMTAAVCPIVFRDEPLILYRQHPGQQMGVDIGGHPRLLTPDYYRMHIRQLETVRRRLEEYDAVRPVPGLDALRAWTAAHVRHIEARLRLPAPRSARVPGVLRELLTRRYHRYSNGWKSALRDML